MEFILTSVVHGPELSLDYTRWVWFLSSCYSVVWAACIYAFQPDSPSMLSWIHCSFKVPASEDWPRVKCINLFDHWSDGRGMSRCVSMPVVFQKKILKHRFLFTPCVLTLEGRYVKFIPCGFFAVIFFFTVFSFLRSIFEQALLFL